MFIQWRNKEIKDGLKDVPNFDFDINTTIIDILVNNNITVSKREAREFLTSGSITVNGEKILDENKIIDKSILIEDNYLIIRKGKKKYFIGKIK